MITPYSNIISVTTLEALLLDTYSGAAAAYSLRLLRSAYTGSAIRVRRAVGSPSEKDIGFVGQNLDVADLESFCSGTDGFVQTWYDQSGNARNATQTTAANQPQIVSAGSLILENGKPSLQFDGINDNLIFSGTSISAQNNLTLISVSGAINLTTSTQFILTAGLPTTNKAAGIAYNSDEKINMFAWGGLDTTSSASYLNQALSFGTIDGTNTSLSINSTNTTTNTLANSISIENSTIHISTRPVLVQLYLNGKTQELITYYSDQSSNRTGIETNINAQYQIYWDGSQTSLLDSYGGSAAAYSLRALSSTYVGPLVRVRRASDNAEQDIYANYDGTLNTTSLESFCSGTNGFVETWYDQSGNANDASQTTSANQPQIVSSGSVILDNGKPSIDFDGTNDFLLLSGISTSGISSMTHTRVYSTAAAAAADVGNTLYGFGNSASTSQFFGMTGATGSFSGEYMAWAFNASITARLGSTTYRRNANTQVLELENWLSSGFDSYQNNNAITIDLSNNWTTTTNSSPSNFSVNQLSIGALVRTTTSGFQQQKAQEYIFWFNDESSNRTGISDNINDFYSIY